MANNYVPFVKILREDQENQLITGCQSSKQTDARDSVDTHIDCTFNIILCNENLQKQLSVRRMNKNMMAHFLF